MSLLSDADIEHICATLPKHPLEPAHSAKARCKFALLKLEGHSGGTYSVRLDNMSGPIIAGAAIVSTILTFDFQHCVQLQGVITIIQLKHCCQFVKFALVMAANEGSSLNMTCLACKSKLRLSRLRLHQEGPLQQQGRWQCQLEQPTDHQWLESNA